MVDTPVLPSLLAIQAFEAAARLGGFAAAARELGTTAASVSYHVARLERQTGLTLFVRQAQRVALTDAGALVAAEAASAFQALRGGFVRAAEHDESVLRITALPTFGAAWLAPRVGAFRELHPGVRVEIDLSAEPRDLSAGACDAAIRNGHGQWPGLRAVRLFPSLFTPLCAPERAGAVALDRAHEPGALPLLGRPDWWRLWFEALGRAPPSADQFGIGLAEEHLDAAAAVAGHGVTIGSPILHARDLAAGRLVPAHPLVVSDGRVFWWVCPVARQRSAKLAAFGAWLVEEARGAERVAMPFLQRCVFPAGSAVRAD